MYIHQFDSAARNKRRHRDGFSVAAAPPLQSHACCGRYVYMKALLLAVLLVVYLCAPVRADDLSCGPPKGPNDELSKLIEVVAHEFEIYEVYFPKAYLGQELTFVEAIIVSESGEEGYFQLRYKEKDGKYYLHMGLEPLDHPLTVVAHYGSGCAPQGRYTFEPRK